MQLLGLPPLPRRLFLGLLAAGDVLAGGASQGIRVGGGRIQLCQLAAEDYHRIPVLRSGPLTKLLLELPDPLAPPFLLLLLGLLAGMFSAPR